MRVVLDPVTLAATGSFEGVTRARVRLVSNGAGASSASTAPQAAELSFSLAQITQSRPGAEAAVAPLATLAGPLHLEGPSQQPILDASAAELVSLITPPLGGEGGNAHGLQLDFDSGSFGVARSFLVPLPEVSDDVKKLELRVDLKLGGATESPASLNDIFDSFFAKVEINEVRIVSLKFVTDHQVLLDNNVDFSGKGNPIGQPEWKFGKQSRPITHTKGRRVDVEIEVEVFPLNADPVDCTVLGAAIFEPKTSPEFPDWPAPQRREVHAERDLGRGLARSDQEAERRDPLDR